MHRRLTGTKIVQAKVMKGSFVPLGTQAGDGREDRSPDLRFSQHLPREPLSSGVQTGFLLLAATTAKGAGALTVAGQWRSFTAFPSILAIAVLRNAALSEPQR